jgi:hypothetical protein
MYDRHLDAEIDRHREELAAVTTQELADRVYPRGLT